MFAYYARWIEDFSNKMAPLIAADSFPLSEEVVERFEMLRNCLLSACLHCISDDQPFTVECYASDQAIGATLNPNERPVAFMSRTLSKSERRYPSIHRKGSYSHNRGCSKVVSFSPCTAFHINN